MNETAIQKILSGLCDSELLTEADLANIAHVRKSVVRAWREGSRSPHPRNQLIISDIRYVLERLLEKLTAEKSREWLFSQNPRVRGERPAELISEGRTDDVLAILPR